MKIVKCELEDEVHSRFKVWAYQAGVTMAKALEGFIESAISSPSKPHKTYLPIEDSFVGGEPLKDRCERCGEEFAVSFMVTHHKTGKKFCRECVELMKAGQA